ncbi:MAG: TIGR02281 family clan AA aspartic protease [bacterium]|nr:TIGR02281 family clan AA aspartic protease [bacterium]
MRVVHRPSRKNVLRALLYLGIAAGCLIAGGASAEIYQWRDARGRLHFAQDLNQVPIEYRAQARGDVVKPEESSRIQHYEAAPAAPASRRGKAGRSSTSSGGGGGQVHKIRVERTGSTMRVNVRLNDSVVAPFYVDTGASDVVLPTWVAKELRLDLAGSRTALYGTANGIIQQSLVTLDSVQLGGARVENVPASVSTSMSTGLLGLSFFNHFRYRIDPVSGTITLQSNGLVESGRIRGGRSESQWRTQFAGLAARRAAIEREKAATSANRSRRQAELDAMIDEVDRQLDVLEDEADEARVPMQWRD